jgi:hypothetical protein
MFSLLQPVICSFCKERGHYISSCQNPRALIIKTEIGDKIKEMLIARYRNIDIYNLVPFDDIYDELNKHSIIELQLMNTFVENGVIINKRKLIAKYIAAATQKLHNAHFGMAIFSSNVLRRMYAELMYWMDIAEGGRDTLAMGNLHNHINYQRHIDFVIKSREIHRFLIKTVLELYNWKRGKWDYACDLDEYSSKTLECPVCIETKKMTDSITLKCSHKFCGECFGKILEKSSSEFYVTNQHPCCPLCRDEVTEIISTNPNMLDSRIRRFCISEPYIVCKETSKESCNK